MKKYIVSISLALLTAAAVSAQSTVKAVALQKDTNLWTLKSEGMMEYAKKDIIPGTVVNAWVTDKKDSNGKALPETVQAVWTTAKKDQKPMSFTRITYQDKEYYVFTNRIAAHQNAAVVISEAATYLNPNLADVRKTSLKPGTIVALGDKTSVFGVTLQEVSYYDEAAYRKRIGYIKASKVSTSSDDIQAMKIIKQAIAIKDASRREAMLDGVKRIKPSKNVIAYMEAQLEALEESGNMLSQGVEYFTAASGYRTVSTNDNSKINVRDTPGTQGGTVTMQLENGTKIICDSYTVKKDTIEGITDSWYYVSNTGDGTPVNGWIFGGFTALDESEM